MNQPTTPLETERLILRGWRETDLDALAPFYAKDPLARFVGGPKSRDDSWRHLAMIMGHWQMRGYGVYAMVPKGTDTAIGWCGPWYPEGFPEREIGYVVFDAANRGKGYVSEAVNRCLDHAWRTLKFPKIASLIAIENHASARVAERCGASLAGTTTFRGFDVNVWRYPQPNA